MATLRRLEDACGVQDSFSVLVWEDVEPYKGSGIFSVSTRVNAEETGQFVWNMATYALREAVNISSEELPPEVVEELLMQIAGYQSKIRL